MGVLDGVKVLEVAEQGFVPSAAAILAEWGADVVKVERPTGDPLRSITRSWASSPHVEGFNILFEQFNRNKRGVAIDLRNDEGRARARRVDRVGRRVHHELPAVGPHEAAAEARGHVGGEPALRVRDRQRAKASKAPTPTRAGSTACRSGRAVASVTSSRRTGGPLVMPGARSVTRRAARFSRAESRLRCVKQARTGEGSLVDVSLLGAAVWTLAVDLVRHRGDGRRSRTACARLKRSSGTVLDRVVPDRR